MVLFDKTYLRVCGISDILWSRLSRSGGRSWRVVLHCKDSLLRECSLTVWSNIYSSSINVSECLRKIAQASTHEMPIISCNGLKAWTHSQFNLTKSSQITIEPTTHSIHTRITGEIASLDVVRYCCSCEGLLSEGGRKHCGNTTAPCVVISLVGMLSSSFLFLPELSKDMTTDEWSVGSNISFLAIRRKCQLVSCLDFESDGPDNLTYCSDIEHFRERQDLHTRIESILRGESLLDAACGSKRSHSSTSSSIQPPASEVTKIAIENGSSSSSVATTYNPKNGSTFEDQSTSIGAPLPSATLNQVGSFSSSVATTSNSKNGSTSDEQSSSIGASLSSATLNQIDRSCVAVKHSDVDDVDSESEQSEAKKARVD